MFWCFTKSKMLAIYMNARDTGFYLVSYWRLLVNARQGDTFLYNLKGNVSFAADKRRSIKHHVTRQSIGFALNLQLYGLWLRNKTKAVIATLPTVRRLAHRPTI